MAGSKGKAVLDAIAAEQDGASFDGLGEFSAKAAPESAKWKIAAGFFTTPNEQARVDIIRKNLPEATFEQDPSGRSVVNYKGERGYINKPGFSARDALDIASGVVKFLPAGKFATAGGTLTSQVLRAGGGALATSVAEDFVAIPQGSEQGIDIPRAVVSVAGAMAGQAATPWLMRGTRAIKNALRPRPVNVTVNNPALFSQQQVAGASDAMRRKMGAAAQDATSFGLGADDAARVAERQALLSRFGISGTRGQITDDFAQQSLEDSLRNADVSTAAGNIMRQFDDAQRAAVSGESGASGFGMLRREIGGRTQFAAPEDAGAVVAGTVKDKAASLKGQVRSAYGTAKAAEAGVRQSEVRTLAGEVENVLRNEFIYDPSLQPRTAVLVEQLRKIDTAISTGELGRKAIPIQRIENIRKLISRTARDPSLTLDDAAAAKVVRDQFDAWADRLAEAGKLTGDPKALDAFKLAREFRREYGALFEAPRGQNVGPRDQAAGQFIEGLVKDSSPQGVAVVRRAIGDPAATQRLLNIVGENSPEHLALKQGSLLEVFGGAIKGGEISPRRFVSLYEQRFAGSQKGAMAVIFNEGDRKAITEFYRAMKVLIPREGTFNPPKTSYKLAHMTQQLMQRLGLGASIATGNPAAAIAVEGAGIIGNSAKTNQAREAVMGLRRLPRVSGAPAVGAAVGSQVDTER